MNCFDIKILNPDINTLEIATCVGDNDTAKIDIATSDNISTLEISTCVATLPEVSGLIPVKDILAGSGISVINATGIYTISLLDTNLTISDISDFLEGVQDIIGNSGLYAGNYINLNYNDTTGFTTVSVTGVQPSGNYSLVGHSHTTSDISNFSTGVSGLLPSLSGSGYVNTSFKNNIYTISVSGLQPSGNYSLVGHTHQASDITNFNSAVSGLIPPSNFTSLTGISGIIVTNSGTDYIVKLDDPTIQLIDITDLSSNARTFLLTPSSSNLSTLVSDETGSGSLVFNNSPNFSGIPTVPTATSGTNTNQIASTAFVRSEINNLIDYAPATLDTLNELAAALGDDANFASTVTNSLASKAAISGVIFTGSVTIPSGTGNFNNLTVNNINVSLSGHSHISSDISDFNTSVSGLLPSVTGTGYINSSFNNNIYSISVSGLQPSGNYSLDGHTHTSSNITDFNSSVSGLLPVKNISGSGYIQVSSSSGDFIVSATGLQPSGNYSVVGHTHVVSDITNFNSGVSGLLPSITGTGYVISTFNNNIYSISVSGLQPSGNYANAIHNHTSSDITDFNSSVSGLLPVKNIVAGTSVSVSSVSGEFTVSVTGVAASSASSIITSCHNLTGSTISKMSAVYINGGHGNEPTIALAIANAESTSSKTFGVTMEDILFNQSGDVVVVGSLIDVNTNQFSATEGTTLYLSPSVSGGLTITKPLAPNHLVTIGKIVRNHNNQGVIEISIQNGFELGELHNVSTNGSGNNGKFLQYNSGSGLWLSSSSGNFTSLSVNGTGVSVNGHSHTSSNITDFNSSVSGLLPSVTGSTYITTNFSNNTYTINATGLQPLLTNPITGIGTSGYLSRFNSSNSLVNSNILQSGNNIDINGTLSISGVLIGEIIDDEVAGLLVAGSGIGLNYNDAANTLTINTSSNIINSSNLYLWANFK